MHCLHAVILFIIASPVFANGKKCCFVRGATGAQGQRGNRGPRGITGPTGPSAIPFGFVSNPMPGNTNALPFSYVSPNPLQIFNATNNVTYFFGTAIQLNTLDQSITLTPGLYSLQWNLYIPNGWFISSSPDITFGFYNSTTSSFYSQSLVTLQSGNYISHGFSVSSCSVIIVTLATENIIFAAQQNFSTSPGNYYFSVLIERLSPNSPI